MRRGATTEGPKEAAMRASHTNWRWSREVAMVKTRSLKELWRCDGRQGSHWEIDHLWWGSQATKLGGRNSSSGSTRRLLSGWAWPRLKVAS